MSGKFRLRKLFGAILATIGILLLLLVSGCLMTSDEREAAYVELATRYQLAAVSLNVLESGNKAGMPLVLIHGTPGSAGFFFNYLTDPGLQDLRLLAIDRPGWGDSILSGEFDAQLGSQSAMLGDWLCQVAAEAPDNRLVIMAHSYGATLSLHLLMDHPECISAALLLAGGADPALTAPRWYNHMTDVPPVSWIVALGRRRLKQSNDEMMNVKAGLEELNNRWHEITVPVTVIQGEEDMLVHPDNADYIEDKLAHIPATVIRRNEDGHMIVHTDRPFVISHLRQLIESVH